MFSNSSRNAVKEVAQLTDSEQLEKDLDDIKSRPYAVREFKSNFFRALCSTIAGSDDPKPLIEKALEFCKQNKLHRDYSKALEEFKQDPQKYIESKLNEDFKEITKKIDYINGARSGSCESDDNHMRDVYRIIATSVDTKALFKKLYGYVHRYGNDMFAYYMNPIDRLNISLNSNEKHFNEVFGRDGYRQRPQQDNTQQQNTIRLK